jgi:hypothetical protein
VGIAVIKAVQVVDPAAVMGATEVARAVGIAAVDPAIVALAIVVQAVAPVIEVRVIAAQVAVQAQAAIGNFRL